MPEDKSLVDVGAERNVLACLLKEQSVWTQLPANFTDQNFGYPLNRHLFLVVDNLYGKNAVADPVAVYEALPPDSQKELEGLGGWAYIDALRSLPIDPHNLNLWVSKLGALAVRRRIADASEKIGEIAQSQPNVEEAMAQVEVVVSEIEDPLATDVVPIGSIGLEYLENKIANAAEMPGLPSGMDQLDASLQGWQPGRLYVAGGRKKNGKSVLLLNWAKHLAVDRHIPVLWVSTEHSQRDEFSRLLSMTSEVWEKLINNGKFVDMPVYVDRINDATQRIAEAPFYFKEMPSPTLEALRRLIRKSVRINGIQAVFFDYIKVSDLPRGATEWQELGRLAYGLKEIAAQENVPIITATQINREGSRVFKAGDEMDSDFFAGSDRIAQAMNVGMIIRSPVPKETEDRDNFRVLEVVDNRNGPATLKMLLSFEAEIIKMSEVRSLGSIR